MKHAVSLQQIEEQAFAEKNDAKRYLLFQEIGTTYLKEGNYAKALECFCSALTLARKAHERNLELDILLNIGLCLFNLDKIHDAISLYQEALTLAKDLRDFRVQIIILGNLAKASLALGENTKAIEYFNRGATLAKREEVEQTEVVYGGLVEAWKRVEHQKLKITQTIIIGILAVLAVALIIGGLILLLQSGKNDSSTSGVLLITVGILTSFVSGLLWFLHRKII